MAGVHLPVELLQLVAGVVELCGRKRRGRRFLGTILSILCNRYCFEELVVTGGRCHFSFCLFSGQLLFFLQFS